MTENSQNQATLPTNNSEVPHALSEFSQEFNFAMLHDNAMSPNQPHNSPNHSNIRASFDTSQQIPSQQPFNSHLPPDNLSNIDSENIASSLQDVEVTMPHQPSESSHGHRRKRRSSDDGGQERPSKNLPLANRVYDDIPRPLHIPQVLPHDRVFNIQVGCQTFSLSGASISSDAPSYFSYYFLKQLEEMGDEERPLRTLHIDRDPDLFRDIARHLQGYHVQIRDPEHFVYLFADAQLFQLPKLMSRLFESEIFISIGGQAFKISKDIFNSPGNSPNFFSLGFSVFFSTPEEVFPGLNKEGLLRPPSIIPPTIPDRSPKIFAEILHYLRGYPIRIKSPEHREELIRDCRYYHLRGLEQRLIPHTLSQLLTHHEITIRLEDVKPSGLSVELLPQNYQDDGDNNDDDNGSKKGCSIYTSVHYARPYVDTDGIQRQLVIETGDNQGILDLTSNSVEFVGDTQKRMTALLQKIADKLGIPATTNITPEPAPTRNTPIIHIQPKFDLLLDSTCHTVVDGKTMLSSDVQNLKDPKINTTASWILTRALWRVQIIRQTNSMILKPCLQAVKLQASVGESGVNLQRDFLSSY